MIAQGLTNSQFERTFLQLIMAPRRYQMDRRAGAAEHTRRKIVEATYSLHAEKGVAATTFRDISTRADVGSWIATDGGNAITGACTQYTLVNGTAGVSNNDGDLCGDMNSGSTTIVPLDILTLTCHDNGSGLLHVGACIGWTEPGADRTCPVPGVTPTTLGYR